MTVRLIALGEVAEVKRGTTITQKQARPGSIPVVAGGMDMAYFHDTANRDGNVITISGSGANAGFVNFWEQPIFASDCSTVEPKIDDLDVRYAYYFLKSKQEHINSLRCGAAQPHVYPRDLMPLQIPLPPLPEQRRLVDLLSRAEGIVRLRREAQAKAAELVPALFLDMFGDPASNPKGWPVVALGEVAGIQGGLQVTKKRSGLPLERPYLRVANVYRDRLSLSEIKNIRLTESELRRTKLLLGDLLFVEGHGNPGEVGRCAIWANSAGEYTHQNHLIRARLETNYILPQYACTLLNSDGGRRALISRGKTTSGLSTISVQNVKDTPTVLPPIQLQHQFAAKAEAIRAIAAQQTAALATAQAAFDALLQRSFAPRPPA